MTLQDKQLLLIDLCGRLPYGTKVKCPLDDEPYTLLSINWNKEIAVIGFVIDGIYVTSKQKLVDIKPFLRPMSSMTEEEKKELNNVLEYQYYADDSCMCEASDWLNAHHFDFRNLLAKGLAIEVTEDNNPYIID